MESLEKLAEQAKKEVSTSVPYKTVRDLIAGLGPQTQPLSPIRVSNAGNYLTRAVEYDCDSGDGTNCDGGDSGGSGDDGSGN